MMNNAWRMNEGANKNWDTKGWAGNSTTPAKNQPSEGVRQRLDNQYGGRSEEKKIGQKYSTKPSDLLIMFIN